MSTTCWNCTTFQYCGCCYDPETERFVKADDHDNCYLGYCGKNIVLWIFNVMKKIYLYIVPIIVNLIFGLLYVKGWHTHAYWTGFCTYYTMLYNILINPICMMCLTNSLLKTKRIFYLPIILCFIVSSLSPLLVNLVWIAIDGYKFVATYFINDFAAIEIIRYQILIPSTVSGVYGIFQMIRYKVVPLIKRL